MEWGWGTLLMGIVVAILIFLLIREVMTWYWKINDICYNQEVANELLKRQNELLRKQIEVSQQSNEILSQFVDDFTNK